LVVDIDPVMERRRTKNRDEGTYVHPDIDGNMDEAVRRYIDLDKIEELIKTNK